MSKFNLIKIAKLPIVGEFIISIGIYLCLSAMAASMNYFNYVDEEKTKLLEFFLFFSILYIIFSLSFRVYLIAKKITQKKL